MNEINTDIASNLTPLEEKVFQIIDQVRRKRVPNTVVRVVGGWTRDKLLNKPSDDIDLMVDNMSGANFANLVVEELGLEKSPHIIEKSPEKTKNIEAAKMYVPIDGKQVELDFVQARTEEYGDNRREVTVRPATAEEDAMRRDLTIGAVFYNLNEKKVEDFTGKGIKDLITNTIRTPYDSGDMDSFEEVKKTFIEDPLRVFRAIRFASKYNGEISPATLSALSDPDVINAIFFSERKIATERIGQEFNKMLKGPTPAMAIKLLKETGLFQHIINESTRNTEYEGNMAELDMDQNNPHHEMNLWEHTYQVLVNLLEHFPEEQDEEKRVILILGALTHDLGKLYKKVHGESASNPGSTSYTGHENESQIIAEHILKFLKFENSIIKQVGGLARYHMYPHSLERGDSSDKALRKFIRKMGEESLNWMDVLNLSVSDAYSKGLDIKPETISSYQNLRNRMEQALASMNMPEDKFKLILNGHQIMQALGVKPGPHMSIVTNYLKDLMDEHPDMTEESAISRLQEIKVNAEQALTSNDNINSLEEAIVYIIQGETRVASGHFRRINACVCPQQLFQKKHTVINELMAQGKHVEALAQLKNLKNIYLEDDKVARLASITMLNVLSKDAKLRDNEILQYILDRTENSMCDPVLHSYATGLLILLKTGTGKEHILKIGEDMIRLSPGTLKGVIDSLPKEVYHDDIRKTLKAKINENL